MTSYSPEPGILKDHVILITGAGTGLGQAAAYAYAEHGATVILLGHVIRELEATYDHIVKSGWPQPAIYALNLSGASIDDYHELSVVLDTEFGRLDGLLHNAAVLETLTPFEHYPLERWYKIMQVNLNAPFLMTQSLLPLLNKAPQASLVFTVDQASTAYRGAYGVSKAGLQGLMHILADELEINSPIRVNSLCPCPARTTLRAHAFPAEDTSKLPLPKDLMAAYLFLMSPASQDIHGKTLNIQANGEWNYDN
jgi:NAD(P)-dependent dehydrogenase (short-subunit alcohol dehydrogenase family)